MNQQETIDALAEQNRLLKETLKRINKYPVAKEEELGYVGCRRVAGEVLSLPDLSTSILNQRDVRTLREVLHKLDIRHSQSRNHLVRSGISVCAADVHQMAAEKEKAADKEKQP